MPSKPASVRSSRSSYHEASESSPLLSIDPQQPSYSGETERPFGPSGGLRQQSPPRWPSIIALSALCGCILAVLTVGFIAPSATRRYVQEAAVLDLSSLSVDSFTERGVRVRVRASAEIDAGRVKNWGVRTLGRIGTAVVGCVKLDDFDLDVRLPDYEHALLGMVQVPGMTVNIRNGNVNELNFVTNTQPGSLETIRLLANKYMNGSLKAVKVVGEVNLTIRKGFLSLSLEGIIKEFVLKDLPDLPALEVTRLHASEVAVGHNKAILANVSAVIENPYPLAFEVPPLGFQVSLPGCEPGSQVAAVVATSSLIRIKPNIPISVDVFGLIQSLPADLTTVCPSTELSPMDTFLGKYLHGEDAVVFVSGDGSNVGGKAPSWLVELLSSVTVPIPFPGHSFDNFIQSFGLSHVKIKLPRDGGDPDDISPLLSATVEAMIRLPGDMNVPLNITRLKATVDVSYQHHAFGTLDIKKWIPAVSERIPNEQLLRVRGEVTDAPLNVTDFGIFQKVIQKVLFGGGGIKLGIAGVADADITTSFGQFIVHNIPASGNIALDGFPGLGSMPPPKLNDIVIDSTTDQSMNLKISVSAENPTPWEAVVPYANVLLSNGGFVIGNGTITDLHLTGGMNTVVVNAAWDPLGYSGTKGVKAGEELLGNYISGHNTTLTLSTHEGSFPLMPEFGKALSGIKITVPTPPMDERKPDGSRPHFIESATMFIFSSTAEFLVKNPLPHNGIIIETLDGVAMYNSSTIGTINNSNKFLIKAGKKGGTTTPRLPVDWSLGGVGYDVMRKALGGELKLHAEATCKLSIGNLMMEVFYNGSDPIGAHVRP